MQAHAVLVCQAYPVRANGKAGKYFALQNKSVMNPEFWKIWEVVTVYLRTSERK
jgi:hypothetical protein